MACSLRSFVGGVSILLFRNHEHFVRGFLTDEDAIVGLDLPPAVKDIILSAARKLTGFRCRQFQGSRSICAKR